MKQGVSQSLIRVRGDELLVLPNPRHSGSVPVGDGWPPEVTAGSLRVHVEVADDELRSSRRFVAPTRCPASNSVLVLPCC